MQLKSYVGTVRARSPKDTLSFIKPVIHEAGITRISNLTNLDCLGLPVYTCIRPTSKSLTTSQGKGLTDDLAMCSAYMEAIEHYFAEQIIVETKSTISKLKVAKYLDPRELPQGIFVNKKMELLEYNWSLATELLTGEKVYIPSCYLSLDLSKPNIEASLFKISSTGLASGNNYEEAVCHGIYESIERHATKLFASLKLSEKTKYFVDISSITCPDIVKIIDKMIINQIDVAIYDLSYFAFGIPTFYCVIGDNNILRKLANFSGYGTHLVKDIALIRAVTEAAQSRLTYIAGSRDDIYPENYQKDWHQVNTGSTRSYNEINSYELTTFSGQIIHTLDVLHTHKLSRILVYRHTPEDYPICTVRVLVPGLNI